MISELTFPSENDFQMEIYQADDIPSTLKHLREIVSTLNSTLSNNFSPQAIDWVNQTLPLIWPLVINLEHPSRSSVREASSLNHEILMLIKKTAFNPHLVLPLVSFFDYNFKETVPFQLHHFNPPEITAMLKFGEKGNYLNPNKPPTSSIITSLVELLFSSGYMGEVIKFLNSKDLTVENLYPLLQLLLQIRTLVSDEYISLVLPFFIKASINMLSQNHLTDNSTHLVHFLTGFVSYMPDILDQVLQLFCELSSHGSVQVQYALVSDIIQIVEKMSAGNSALTIKSAMISAASNSSTHHSLLREIFHFLPSLLKFISFSENDLLDLLMKSQVSSSNRFTAIVKIIEDQSNTMTSNLDNLALSIIQANIFFPALHCALIDRVSSDDLSKKLFLQLLSVPERLSKYDLSALELNEKIKQYMQDFSMIDSENGVVYLESLSYLYMGSPDLPTLPGFLMQLIDQSEQTSELFGILHKFTDIINKFESKVFLMNLFMKIYKLLQEQTINLYTASLLNLLTEWIDNTEHINADVILDNLKNLNFINCISAVFPLINSVLKRTKNEHNIRNFLYKIIFDTTQPKHAEWLIRELFKVIHRDRAAVQQIVEMLIRHLADPLKIDNAIYLIYYASLYEADYFRLKQKTFGFVQKILIKYDPPISMNVSLHPFHSTRRIYLEVALEFRIKANQLSITQLSGCQDFSIPLNYPLTTLDISPYEPLKLDAAKISDSKETQEVYTPFLDALNNQTYISLLYQRIEPGFSQNEIVFQILQLFLPFHNVCASNMEGDISSEAPFVLPHPANMIQGLFHNLCENPQNFIEFRHIYPYALKAFADSGQKLPPCEVEAVFENFATAAAYDSVSLAVACAALFKICDEYQFFKIDTIRKCLIESNFEVVRQTFLSLISPDTDKNIFVSLIHETLKKENRNKSKQFYMWMKMMEYPSDIFLPFFKNLTQYEFSHYSDSDETYISLLELIPVSEETIDITLNRLFAPPTCNNLNQPFVQTIESWKASLNFLLNQQAVPKLNALLLNLPQVPSPAMKLSDDFSNKGRNGIVNLGSTCYVNSLLQIFNVFSNISLKLINKQSDQYSPFVARLRELLAELRFVRGTSLSIRPLVDTIPNFNVSQQEDAEEFLNILVNKISDNGSPEIAAHLQGEQTLYIQTNDRILSSEKQQFYYLTFPTKGLNRLDDAFKKYVEDSKFEGGYSIGDTKVEAFRGVKITKWPEILCIQLQRLDITLETQEKHKLVHEFDFPIELDICKFDSSSDIKYMLKGVIVHQGSAEQGHYFAIVQDHDNEWYVCNDHLIEYFEISHLPEWAFGIPDDKSGMIDTTGTGYLLFYEQENLDHFSANVPDDLEEKLNLENEQNWPSVIFFSEQFISFAMDMLLLNTQNEGSIRLALNVLFRIAVINEKIVEEWIHVLSEHVFNHQEQCHLFFDFIDNHIGKSLPNIVMLSDSLSKLVVFIFQQVKESTKPLLTLLRNFNNSSKTKVVNTVLTIIPIACKSLKVEWADEDEALLLMIQYLSIEMQRDYFKTISKQHCLALNATMALFYEVLMKKGCIEAIRTTFEFDVLNRIYSSAKKSENFQKLMTKVNLMRPDLFAEVGEAPNYVKQLLAPIISVAAASDSSETIDINTDFIWANYENYLFHKEESYRRESANLAIRLLGDVEPGIEKFFEESLLIVVDENDANKNNNVKENINVDENVNDNVDENINNNVNVDINANVKQRPSFPDPSAIPLYFAGLIPKACQMVSKDEKVALCDHFLDILIRLCRIIPETVGLYFRMIAGAFFTSKNLKLLHAVHDLLAYDTNMKDEFNPEDIVDLLATRCASKECVHLLFFFKDSANQSALSGACVEHYLRHTFDQGADILIEMIKGGLVPGDFEIPDLAESIVKLKLANVLWDAIPEKREKLSNFMLSAIKISKPFRLLSHCPTVKTTCSILKDYCVDSLESIVGQIVL